MYKAGIIRKLNTGIFVLMLSVLIPAGRADASKALPEDIDYSQIQEVIDDIMEQDDALDFGAYVGRLMNGEESFSLRDIGGRLIYSIKGEFKANISTFGRLISIALITAIFTNLAIAFKNSQISETGYYVTYLMLFGLLITTFISASITATRTVGNILDFMKALVPAYFLSVGFCTGSATSIAYYESSLVIISMVDLIIVKGVIPMVNIYLVIMLVNNISKEDMLSRLAGLFETAVNWLLKSLLAAIVGFQTIQALILPVADQVKRSALFKAAEAIPGIGNSLGSVTETVIGAGVLLKNSIGTAGLIVILTICAIPLLKLLVITLIYKCACAVLQPISDKRVIECISASAKSSQMLLQSIFAGAALFLISITIAAVSTKWSG